MSRYYYEFSTAIDHALTDLKLRGEKVDSGHWQGLPTEGKPDLATKEILNLRFEVPMQQSIDDTVSEIKPNLPWAEDHFQERVSRVPTNPGEEYMNWPWWAPEKEHSTYASEISRTEFLFTHTYQERFWAGDYKGIRYWYGDLDDVIALLYKYPYTRQATFPIFFPEDTGATHGGRIPCTLHYHFLMRDGKLHMWYTIRSCDAVRHFRDDLYMCVRLCHWVLDQLREREFSLHDKGLWHNVRPGVLHFTACSFHVHMGDHHLL